MRRDVTASAYFLLALNFNAFAHETECHQVANDTARLKCYDDAHQAVTKDTSTTLAVRPHARAQEAPADQSFGMTNQLRNQDAAPAAETQTRLAAVIVKATESARGGLLRLTLDNGQQWTLLEGHRPGEFEAGDKVGIRAGAFGSYRIRSQSGGRILRVRRIR